METKKCLCLLLENQLIRGVLMEKLRVLWRFLTKAVIELGWITPFFSTWLKEFDYFVSRTRERRVLLLIDNASSHGRIENLSELANVDVLFLPKNKTSVLQPLDPGVIACVKQRYRRKQYERALGSIENEDTRDLYNVNLLQAIQWVPTVWDGIEAKVIYNCWEKNKVN